ncbi:NADH:flavin oxidoreductase [Chromatiales bacterium (ex Bugula neritina AB1)]|nr:NADH:flavin oxidoreductase [Chromatiales bacterium (ex Bugula neritina AB1)]
MRDPKYDILFEPVKIGPVTAPNRFYQVPHCTGMGYRYPRTEARFRGIKAEGGWGVVSTQESEIHPSTDITPANEARIWDERDIPALQLMTDAVHEHGSLAAIQLVHNGLHTSNRYSRCSPLGPSAQAVIPEDPIQARAMSKADIAEFRRWHRQAALRGREAGFDIIYVYAGHDMTLLQHFLLQRYNHRSDEYGGSLENRLRLFREVLADTKDAVGDTCAIAVRLAVDELLGNDGLQHDGEAREIVEALAEEPDLWDVNISDWSNDSQSSRFSEEGYQEPYTGFVKSLTTKPVVGVGRYTSPDTMVRVLKSGLLDFIGAARPSIADPFLPKKIETGRPESIRECIGCNICITGDNTNVPMRCTQNPVVGEEWRRDWHPEYIPTLADPEPCLIVGGGPAGLEAARALTQRGVHVTLSEATDYWGGRVHLESRLPGLATWSRVRDSRLWQLQQLASAELYLQSRLTADNILESGIAHVAIATGAKWRRDGVGRAHRLPLAFLDQQRVISPDDLMSQGICCIAKNTSVVIFDDDRFYLASVLAELVASSGVKTTFVTPSAIVAPWSDNTLEQERIQKRLIELDIEIIPSHTLSDMSTGTLTIQCGYSGRLREIPCGQLLPVTSRTPDNTLWTALNDRRNQWQDSGIRTVTRIGDCHTPGLIATSCYSGHQYAREYAATDKPQPLREDIILQ